MSLEAEELGNCDQRLHEDVTGFIGGTRRLSFGFIDAVVRLCIFFLGLHFNCTSFAILQATSVRCGLAWRCSRSMIDDRCSMPPLNDRRPSARRHIDSSLLSYQHRRTVAMPPFCMYCTYHTYLLFISLME